MIYPIGFSIPTCKIVPEIPIKSELFSYINPKNTATYIYTTETDYYNDYKESVFDYTCCKGGWDCLRHYEILANGCIPWFYELDKCPKNTLTHLPKKLIKECMETITNINETEKISNYISELLEYTSNHLSSKSMAKYILNVINKKDTKNVLLLSSKMEPDYQRCLTLIGFKELLGAECHDYPMVKHIYNNMTESEAKHIYGKGFTYSRIFDKNEYRNQNNDSTIEEDIQNHKYDIIIYGNVHHSLLYWDLVNKHYTPDEIVLICGEDIHNCDKKYLGDTYNLFIRELS